MIVLATGWFEIVEIHMFDLEEVTKVNDEYIDKSSAMVSHLFNNKWIFRSPGSRKVVFENGSEFKSRLHPFAKEILVLTP